MHAMVSPSPRSTRVVVGLIRVYQLGRAGHVSPCRFTPTCSEYAAQALARHGVVRGLGLTVRRLGRCHPFGSFGADPVPE
ncbi:MAG: membrane protein insertion efficiency factor YidD [Acidimicrobiales bacterium]